MSACNALITAASRGLGLAAAEALAEKGCNLIISSRKVENLVKAKDHIKRIYKGVSIDYIAADLRKEADVKKLIKESLKRYGRVDVVILNYGNPSCEPCTVIEASWDDWIEAAALYLASTATIAKLLIESNPTKATLIIISSFTVLEPSPYLIVSDTTRSGLTRLIKILSRSYPDKLRVLGLLLGSFKTPGAIETVSKISSKFAEPFEVFWREKVEGISPLKRAGSIEEFKKLISWIALESPEYLTGSIILFDGATTRSVLI
jgi:NAD(P)-dependent dehydrogenase (short-subunit alcohol dehydrogenase family)